MSGNSAMLPKAGDIIDGKYELMSLLGQGGMGAVYKARHRTLGNECAIKVMLADTSNPEAIARFEREGRAAANLHSEHIVRVFDVDQEHGYAYMVLELLDGEDLAQLLDRERCVPPHVAVGYVLQALDGMKEAHAQGIVHRDLKPSNLFLSRKRDGTVIVKVLDFGISKAGNSNALSQTPGARTSTKAMLGSPLYMSPEQLRSSKSVDARADIWAVGVILFELLTGELPFMGENLGELFAAILENDAPGLRAKRPEVPPGLEQVVLRCLQRKPESRPASASDLIRELAPFATPTTASPYAMSNIASTPNYGPPGVGNQPTPLGTALLAPHANPAMYMQGMRGTGPHSASAPPGMGTQGMPIPMQTPQNVQGPPAMMRESRHGSITGSPVVKGTAPLGAITPQPNGPGWQPGTTDNSEPTVAKSSVLPVILGVGALAVILAGVGGFAIYKNKTTGGVPTSEPSSTPPPSATASIPSPPESASAPTASASSPPAASTTPPATSVATPATQIKPHGPGGTHAKVPDPPKPDPLAVRPPDPPKPVDPPPKPVEPPHVPAKPPASSTSVLQGGR